MESSESDYINYFKMYLKKISSHVTKINTLEEEYDFDEIARMNLLQESDDRMDTSYDSANDLIRHLTSILSGRSSTSPLRRNTNSRQPSTPHNTPNMEMNNVGGIGIYDNISHMRSSLMNEMSQQPPPLDDSTENSFDTNNIFATIITENMMTDNDIGTTYVRSYQVPISGDLGRYLTTLFGGLLSNFRASDPNDVILPLTDDAFDKLEDKKFEDPNKCDKCTICQEKFEPDTTIKILPCKHIFHKECISEWLKNYHHKCPICRADCGEYAARV